MCLSDVNVRVALRHPPIALVRRVRHPVVAPGGALGDPRVPGGAAAGVVQVRDAGPRVVRVPTRVEVRTWFVFEYVHCFCTT